MPKPAYALIHSQSPPAFDIVRQDYITKGEVAVGANIEFTCFKGKVKKKDVYEEKVPGEILFIGLKKHLECIHLGPDKSPVPKELALGPRRKEEAKDIREQNLVTANYLHQINQSILEPGSSVPAHQPAVRQPVGPVNRRPKTPASAEKQNIIQEFRNLACWKNDSTKQELFGKKVYLCPLLLARWRRKYDLKPKKLYLRMISHLVTKKLLVRPGVSARGMMGCVGVDSRIVDVSFALALSVFKEAGGDPKTVKWIAEDVLETFIGNCRRLYTPTKDCDDSSSDEEMEIDLENPMGGGMEDVDLQAEIEQREVIGNNETEESDSNKTEDIVSNRNENEGIVSDRNETEERFSNRNETEESVDKSIETVQSMAFHTEATNDNNNNMDYVVAMNSLTSPSSKDKQGGNWYGVKPLSPIISLPVPKVISKIYSLQQM